MKLCSFERAGSPIGNEVAFDFLHQSTRVFHAKQIPSTTWTPKTIMTYTQYVYRAQKNKSLLSYNTRNHLEKYVWAISSFGHWFAFVWSIFLICIYVSMFLSTLWDVCPRSHIFSVFIGPSKADLTRNKAWIRKRYTLSQEASGKWRFTGILRMYLKKS